MTSQQLHFVQVFLLKPLNGTSTSKTRKSKLQMENSLHAVQTLLLTRQEGGSQRLLTQPRPTLQYLELSSIIWLTFDLLTRHALEFTQGRY